MVVSVTESNNGEEALAHAPEEAVMKYPGVPAITALYQGRGHSRHGAVVGGLRRTMC